MSTTLQRIRAEVEKRVKARLAGALVEAHIQWHTRKGLREGCDCNFCVEKKAGTRYIGYTPFPLGRYKEELAKRSEEDAREIAKEVVRKERDRKRGSVRAALLRSKQDIL